MTTVGSSVPRVDGPDKVSGQARYAVDFQLPGVLHTRGVRSPYPHAKVLAIDVSQATRIPGVVTLTREDLVGRKAFFGPVFKDQPVVAIDRVRYVGDLVAAVAAEDPAVAEEAAALIKIDYEPLSSISDPLEALAPNAPLLHESFSKDAERDREESIQPGLETLRLGRDSNRFSSYHFQSGDIERGFREADRILEDVYRVPPIQHAHLEPHNAIAWWEGDRLVVHCSSQDPWVVKTELADLLDVPLTKVKVVVPYVGGGYGGKLYPRIEPVVALLARKAARPVRWTLSREEVFLTITRHGAVVKIKTGVTLDGRLTARQVEVYYDAGAYAEISPRVAAQNGPVAAGPYQIANVSVDCHTVYTCKPPAGAFRGFGVPQLAWAYESQMDDLARVLGIDPVELRLRNLYQEGDTYLTGETLHGVGVRECLRKVTEALGWGQAGSETGAPSELGLVRGVGFACCIKSTMTPSNSAADLRLDADGSLYVLTSGVEVGQGMRTALAQIAADSAGVDFRRVHVTLPDTDMTPFDHGTKSSRVTFSVGRAVADAARQIRAQLVQIGSDAMEASEADLEATEGEVRVRGTNRGMTIQELFRARFGLPVGNLYGHSVFQTVGGLDPVTYKGKDSAFWMWGAVGATVAVDLETGKVRVLQLVSAVDAGRAINPTLCHLQNEGSATIALGSALMEEMVFEEGQPLNASFVAYMVPSIEDFPDRFESILVEAPHPDGPFGAKGVGESTLPAVAPAIANAVANALGGRRIRELPLRPDRVLAAITGQAGASQ